MAKNDFDNAFDNSKIPEILKKTKTISKEEWRAIYQYIEEKHPSTIFEFGAEYGVSAFAFLEMANWLKIKVDFHSWDIVDRIKCVDKTRLQYHLDDITGREHIEFDKYKPDLVFLDAHPYVLTKNIIKICLSRKINFMCHDVGLNIWEKAKHFSNNFTSGFTHCRVAWELYVLMELIDKSLLEKDFFENDKVKVRMIRDMYGLAIVEVK